MRSRPWRRLSPTCAGSPSEPTTGCETRMQDEGEARCASRRHGLLAAGMIDRGAEVGEPGSQGRSGRSRRRRGRSADCGPNGHRQSRSGRLGPVGPSSPFVCSWLRGPLRAICGPLGWPAIPQAIRALFVRYSCAATDGKMYLTARPPPVRTATPLATSPFKSVTAWRCPIHASLRY